MNRSTVLLAIGMTAATAAVAGPPALPDIQFLGAPPSWPAATISLNRPDSLDRLRESNPRHYAIVRRILAAANEICDASKAGVIATGFDAQNLFCAQGIWLTSNPPKRQLAFRIDDTQYEALVAVPAVLPTLEPAH